MRLGVSPMGCSYLENDSTPEQCPQAPSPPFPSIPSSKQRRPCRLLPCGCGGGTLPTCAGGGRPRPPSPQAACGSLLASAPSIPSPPSFPPLPSLGLSSHTSRMALPPVGAPPPPPPPPTKPRASSSDLPTGTALHGSSDSRDPRWPLVPCLLRSPRLAMCSPVTV